MVETNLRKIVDEYSNIVKLIEKLEISEEEQISKLKAKLRLFDGTILWVREVWLKEKIEAYSYYWLRPDETVIIGWDNAPHHREVNSFPHHMHVGEKIEPSSQRDLKEVLGYIKDFLGLG
jgi:hypothetical protein